MNCIVIEDQLPAQRILKKYIQDMGTLTLQAAFTDALEAIQFLTTQDIDVIFLDIHLPKLSGIDFLKTLKNPPQIIFTTAFSEYALEGYDLNVVDYLLKPFSFQRFVQAVQKVKQTNTSENIAQTPAELFIKSGYEHIKIKITDILHIKSDTDYTEFVLENKKILSTEPLRYWEQTLKNSAFVRVHKSYLINTSKIEKVSSNQIYLGTATIIPIGRAYKDDFFKWLS